VVDYHENVKQEFKDRV